jgi:hypothetical protein
MRYRGEQWGARIFSFFAVFLMHNNISARNWIFTWISRSNNFWYLFYFLCNAKGWEICHLCKNCYLWNIFTCELWTLFPWMTLGGYSRWLILIYVESLNDFSEIFSTILTVFKSQLHWIRLLQHNLKNSTNQQNDNFFWVIKKSKFQIMRVQQMCIKKLNC